MISLTKQIVLFCGRGKNGWFVANLAASPSCMYWLVGTMWGSNSDRDIRRGKLWNSILVYEWYLAERAMPLDNKKIREKILCCCCVVEHYTKSLCKTWWFIFWLMLLSFFKMVAVSIQMEIVPVHPHMHTYKPFPYWELHIAIWSTDLAASEYLTSLRRESCTYCRAVSCVGQCGACVGQCGAYVVADCTWSYLWVLCLK